MSTYKVGELLFLIGEETSIMVVMSNEQGVRYYNPLKPELDDRGNIKTYYASNTFLYEHATTLGTVELITKKLSGVGAV